MTLPRGAVDGSPAPLPKEKHKDHGAEDQPFQNTYDPPGEGGAYGAVLQSRFQHFAADAAVLMERSPGIKGVFMGQLGGKLKAALGTHLGRSYSGIFTGGVGGKVQLFSAAGAAVPVS